MQHRRSLRMHDHPHMHGGLLESQRKRGLHLRARVFANNGILFSGLIQLDHDRQTARPKQEYVPVIITVRVP